MTTRRFAQHGTPRQLQRTPVSGFRPDSALFRDEQYLLAFWRINDDFQQFFPALQVDSQRQVDGLVDYALVLADLEHDMTFTPGGRDSSVLKYMIDVEDLKTKYPVQINDKAWQKYSESDEPIPGQSSHEPTAFRRPVFHLR